ncbi:asparagine synthase (glutamine-hydrolyzing) [Candidatus Kaiserbacteria bacterium RIFCSPHIGHO2_02_FULL_54_11b]|uniref:asparagine synthase (glutamine-hydrolyzing) n=2 Tax=Candidatus Kaiseribacteriota TaxID=1752734 RepID=A0A1F6CRQ1_9BACT|nr:MAG: asparagine synthase (glutamine-hydrolyzing) [Candidatus Kaiserbacteria bacterium RIFCSPHIGHO2_01_FULL_54_36b]OGG64647.1 MAG: asparagine synthase (glutamine-hydrolyzing) [Candidatus Kaiserbacteria bacterium RIFCSPHIGHO2_02_FULL_54_11b]
MCAINGLVRAKRDGVHREHDRMLVAQMNEATKHRGPDGTAVWADEYTTFGHNRLAIIDLDPRSNQPMTSASGRFTITFNGEIFNFKELKRELSYPYKTEGDTEVILAAFEKWGTKAFARLRGQFGLGIWDTREKVLYLARDHSGIKPLYYHSTPERLIFSSELKGVLKDSSIARRFNHTSLERYVRLRYVPEPDSLVEDVSKLPPGSFAVWREGTLVITNYFLPELQPLHEGSAETIARRVEELVDASVKQELIADRPIGLFLSGGLDSSIVLDSASRAGAALDTFSLAYELGAGEEAEKFNADAALAKQTAAQYDTRHHEFVLTEKEFLATLHASLEALDQPIANATSVAQYALAKMAREHVVVALLGDGGDELFGGYPRYRFSRLMDAYQTLPQPLRSVLSTLPNAAKLDTPLGIARVERFLFEKDAMLKGVVASEFLTRAPYAWYEGRYLHGRNEVDFTQLFMDSDRRSWLTDEALARTDAMTMAHALEARVPLLNPDIVAYASRIPTKMRVRLMANKWILRKAFGKRLPAHILSAKKRGWFTPTAKWLRRPEVNSLAKEIFSRGYHAGSDELLHSDGALAMLDAHVAKGRYAMSTLWMLVTLRVWAKTYDVSL